MLPIKAAERVHQLLTHPLHRCASIQGVLGVQQANSIMSVTEPTIAIEIRAPLSSDVQPTLHDADLAVACRVSIPLGCNLENRRSESVQQIPSSSSESFVFDHQSVRIPNVSSAAYQSVEQQPAGNGSECSSDSPATHSTPAGMTNRTQASVRDTSRELNTTFRPPCFESVVSHNGQWDSKQCSE